MCGGGEGSRVKVNNYSPPPKLDGKVLYRSLECV